MAATNADIAEIKLAIVDQPTLDALPAAMKKDLTDLASVPTNFSQAQQEDLRNTLPDDQKRRFIDNLVNNAAAKTEWERLLNTPAYQQELKAKSILFQQTLERKRLQEAEQQHISNVHRTADIHGF